MKTIFLRGKKAPLSEPRSRVNSVAVPPPLLQPRSRVNSVAAPAALELKK